MSLLLLFKDRHFFQRKADFAPDGGLKKKKKKQPTTAIYLPPLVKPTKKRKQPPAFEPERILEKIDKVTPGSTPSIPTIEQINTLIKRRTEMETRLAQVQRKIQEVQAIEGRKNRAKKFAERMQKEEKRRKKVLQNIKIQIQMAEDEFLLAILI